MFLQKYDSTTVFNIDMLIWKYIKTENKFQMFLQYF